MAYLILVQVLDSCQNLVKEPACLAILESPLLHYVVEKLTARCILHDKEQLFGRFNNFIELHDIRMSDNF